MTRCELILQACPGRRDELIAALERLELAAVSEQSDLIAAEISVPLDDPETVIVGTTWPSPAHCERWLDGPAWARISSTVEPLIATVPEWHLYRLVDAVA
jgi:quinol monooxygenase YgiN